MTVSVLHTIFVLQVRFLAGIYVSVGHGRHVGDDDAGLASCGGSHFPWLAGTKDTVLLLVRDSLFTSGV